ncbi:hypothetical protein [uncultured Desulfobulbus sp.]|uniref:hypothetical protein n=1 Tax=uncultured Desulfobulbus sp. TaxID=239745 RepID=UPI0029C62EB3|nr:hypothetical protein [uncultured Desulfobulbus sp.]
MIMRTIKTGYCPSLSGRTTLTYHVGWLEAKISFRLFENSSGGLFSKEWVSLERLGIEEGKPISATAIQSLFSGKSSNTGGFLLAVLLKEGLIKPIDSKGRHYQGCDPEAFKTAMQTLVESEAPAEKPPRQKKRGAAVNDIGECHNESRTIE